jgi:hypothetical protein
MAMRSAAVLIQYGSTRQQQVQQVPRAATRAYALLRSCDPCKYMKVA